MKRSTRRRTVSVLVAALSALVVACGQDDTGSTAEEPTVQTPEETAVPDRSAADESPPSIRPAIDEAADLFAATVGGTYVLTFEFISQATAEAGPIRVAVVDGRAAEVTYPDTISEQILPLIPLLTVDDFFARARSVLADGGLVEVEFDEFYGHPLTMTLDPIPDAIDDEMSIVVQSVEPGEQSVATEGY